MTPAMQQYVEIKSQYPDHIVLFRMGDFFETFYDDAKNASHILNITLTARDRERKVPMAGIPFHALDTYLEKLIEANQKVVIVEQLESPSEAKGVVKRGIVKIVTPGTDTGSKNPKQSNYLSALFITDNAYDLAYFDIIEGILYYSTFTNSKELENSIGVLQTREILVSHELDIKKLFSKEFNHTYATALTRLESTQFDSIQYPESIQSELIPKLTRLDNKALYALLNYLYSTQKTELNHIHKIICVDTKSVMTLDTNTIRNLELIEGNRKESTALIDILDHCKTGAGTKTLKYWLTHPLLKRNEILKRQENIQTFVESGKSGIEEIQNYLSQMHDLSRISSKIGLNSANARDLRNAVETIKILFQCNELLKKSFSNTSINDLCEDIDTQIKHTQKTLAQIDEILTETPPLTIREGGMIKSGYDSTLDQLHSLKTGGKEWLSSFEQREIEKSGIPTLKVRFNKVFGYYIEVSKAQSDKVPDYFIRKQTLVNAERYITPELKEQEANILGAHDRIAKLEYDIFCSLIEKAKTIIPQLQLITQHIAEIDIYLSLASVSIDFNWIRPEINDQTGIIITQGRHPVVEHLLRKQGKNFVHNDIHAEEACSLLIITGPNMGGKSTFIRQIALITLLAQVGSFVPASKAVIGLVDRIFTRVGASDNLSDGESTFMVEMLETAEIIKNASSRSLIILDEVGRGTSTFDGMSIAWAICEYLQKLSALTLFATHYHELTELSNKYTNVGNLTVKVADFQDEVIFMHKIIRGKADKSYGIHVAKLAGLPDRIIKTAQSVLKLLEKEKNRLQPRPQSLFSDTLETSEPKQSNQFHEIESQLINLDLNSLSPMEALQQLHKWKDIIETKE